MVSLLTESFPQGSEQLRYHVKWISTLMPFGVAYDTEKSHTSILSQTATKSAEWCKYNKTVRPSVCAHVRVHAYGRSKLKTTCRLILTSAMLTTVSLRNLYTPPWRWAQAHRQQTRLLVTLDTSSIQHRTDQNNSYSHHRNCKAHRTNSMVAMGLQPFDAALEPCVRYYANDFCKIHGGVT